MFVVAIAELSHELVVNHTLGGFAVFGALFVPVFVAWQGFSFYADRFDTDDVFFRVCMLAAMLAVAALAIQIPSVTHGESTGFALSYIAIRVLTVILNLRAYRHVPLARPLIGRYVAAFGLSVALWTVSLAVPEPWRFLLWGMGLAADLGVPALIGPRFVGRVPIHASHIPERFALFTIIVLGESVVAVALGVADSDWRLSSAAGGRWVGPGSIAKSPDGGQIYYVHHGRPSATGGPRKLYTERLFMQGTPPDVNGNPTLDVDQTTSDRPVPYGVAPYSISSSTTSVARGTWHVQWQVSSASGALLALANPLNRVTVSLDRPGTVTPDADGQGATVTLNGRGTARLTYQRRKAVGTYEDVYNIFETPDGAQRQELVSVAVKLG